MDHVVKCRHNVLTIADLCHYSIFELLIAELVVAYHNVTQAHNEFDVFAHSLVLCTVDLFLLEAEFYDLFDGGLGKVAEFCLEGFQVAEFENRQNSLFVQISVSVPQLVLEETKSFFLIDLDHLGHTGFVFLHNKPELDHFAQVEAPAFKGRVDRSPFGCSR